MQLINLAERIKTNNVNYIEYYSKSEKLKKNFTEFYQDVIKVVSMLKSKNIGEGDYIGIFSRNNYEWIVIDVACFIAGHVLVAFPESFTSEQIYKYVKMLNVKLLYSDADINDLCADFLEVVPINEVKNYPEVKNDIELPILKKDRKFTVVFSSGTTGIPKAIALRQDAVEKTILAAGQYFEFSSSDKNLCFLPLSVFTSRMYIYSALLCGFQTTITIPELVLPALRIYKPSIMQGVPYFFENVANVFNMKLNEKLSTRMIYSFYQILRKLKITFLYRPIQKKIYKQIKDTFGGNIRYLITGTAPISERTLRIYEEANLNLFESYGLNETGVLTVNSPNNYKIGSVGKILPQYDIYIDPQNQVIIKSDYFWCDGYLDNENKDKFRVNEDGFYETGDTGYIDNDGFLYLTGRCVDTITLKNGNKLNPQEIEKYLNKSELIKQSLVYSKDLKMVNAIVVKQSPEVSNKDIEMEIKKINYEIESNKRINEFICINEAFTVENKLITPNLKLNRSEIIKKYIEI